MQRPSRAKYCCAPSSSSIARFGTIGSAMSCECGWESEAPADLPWLRKSSRYLKRSSRSRSRYRSRYIHRTETSCAGGITAGWSVCRGVSMITSWAPTPPMPSKTPSAVTSVDPSMRRAGYLFATTRTCQPGSSGFVPGRRIAAISGGVRASRPSQNGHVSEALACTSPRGKSVGRAARSVAMITHRRVTGSLRSSGTNLPPRGARRRSRLRAHRVCCVQRCVLAPRSHPGARGQTVRVQIAARRAAPREILAHPRLLKLPPRARVPKHRDRSPHRVEARVGRVLLEHEAVGVAARERLRGGVHDRVGQPPGPAHDGNRAVPEAVELVEAGGLIPGGHEEDVRPGLDTVGERVVEPQGDRHVLREAAVQALEQRVVPRLARPEQHELGARGE